MRYLPSVHHPRPSTDGHERVDRSDSALAAASPEEGSRRSLPRLGRFVCAFLTALGTAWAGAPGRGWIDVRLERVVPTRNVGIPNCDAMVGHQWELARVRDTIKQVVATGRSMKSECQRLDDSAAARICSSDLDSLRRVLKLRKARESILQDSVRRHAGRCNAGAFKAWQDLQSLRTHQDTASLDSGATASSFDQLVEAEFASVWNNERSARELRSRTGRRSAYLEAAARADANRFQERVKSYLGRQGGRNPSPMTQFLLAVVDHRSGRDDLALARLRRVPARDSASPWKAPIALLYGQVLAGSSPDSATTLLRTAMADPELANTARYILAEIELDRHRPDRALAHLAAYLGSPPAPRPGSRTQAIELAALCLMRMADKPSRIHETIERHMPKVASDSIAFEVARSLIAEHEYRESLRILSGFQVAYPDTRLADDARKLLADAQRKRRGSLLSW